MSDFWIGWCIGCLFGWSVGSALCIGMVLAGWSIAKKDDRSAEEEKKL